MPSSVADIDRLVANGVCAHNDATPLILNDAPILCFMRLPIP
jgi:hypothetical protein